MTWQEKVEACRDEDVGIDYGKLFEMAVAGDGQRVRRPGIPAVNHHGESVTLVPVPGWDGAFTPILDAKPSPVADDDSDPCVVVVG